MTKRQIQARRDRERLRLYPSAMTRARVMLESLHAKAKTAFTRPADIKAVYDVLGDAFDAVMKIGDYVTLPGDCMGTKPRKR